MNRMLLFMFGVAVIVSSTREPAVSTTAAFEERAAAMITEGNNLLREGDLVVRDHIDETSHFIKNFNRKDKSYSHAGIVMIENGYPFVYHILVGEDNPGGKLRKDSLSHFVAAGLNAGYGIFRYDLDAGEQKSLRSILMNWYHAGLSFDPLLELHSDDKMYCSEMMSKLLYKATDGRIQINTTRCTPLERQLFLTRYNISQEHGKDMKVVAIDDLYCNTFCREVRRFQYQ